jgi:hypothetical protein
MKPSPLPNARPLPASPVAATVAGVVGVVPDVASSASSGPIVHPALRPRLRDRVIVTLATLGLVGGAAFLQARGVGQVMAAELVAPSPASVWAAASAPANESATATATPAGDADAHRIALRSYPHSHAVLGTPVAGGGDAADWPESADAPVDLYAAPPCSDVALAALAVFADPRASLATLRLRRPEVGGEVGAVEGHGATIARSVGQGESVLDGRVLFIGQDRVWIERPPRPSRQGVRVCQARLEPGPAH